MAADAPKAPRKKTERALKKSTETALYRYFDSTGELLYVGISVSAVQRLSQHSRSGSGWMRLVKRIEIDRYATRAAAHEAERAAIRLEKPLFNIMFAVE